MTREEAALKLSFHMMQCGLLMPLGWIDKNGEGSELFEAFKMAQDALREPNAMLVQQYIKVREEPKWISVEDRLPENEKTVLAYYGFDHAGSGDLGMMFTGTLSYFCFDPEPHWQHASHGLVVTHWMPLPEPPEGE